jgi:4-amino-4-deoxy-L-arabinose transferase-like glycosyltransferase
MAMEINNATDQRAKAGPWTRAPGLAWGAVTILAFILYLALSSYQIDLPGLSYDEALDATPAMQTVLDLPLDVVDTFTLAGREWPLMVMPYVGPTTSYLVMPAFALFEITVSTLRIANILLGLATLLLAWGFLRDFLDGRVAALSVLLLAVNPTFIFWTRIGAIVSLPMLPLSIVVLWSLWRWYSRGRTSYLLLAAFCLGLGLSTKLLFVWLWVGLAAAWLLLSPWLRPGKGWAAWRWPLERSTPVLLALAAAMLLLGSAPLLLYNLHDLGTVQVLTANLTQTQLYGVDNLNVLANLRTVFLDDFSTLLRGAWWSGPSGELHVNRLALPAFLLAAGALPLFNWRGRLIYRARRLALFYVLIAAIVAQSAVTVSSLGATHLMILWPMPQALTAAALINGAAVLLARPPGRRWLWLGLAGAVALALIAAELRTTWQYHQALQRSGGAGWFSDAIYDLADDLEAVHDTPIIALDWGFRRSLQLLTQERVNPEERFSYTAQPEPVVEMFINWRVTQGPALYLLHTPAATAFPGHREVFEDAAYRHRLAPTLWKRYHQRDGEPVIEVFTLEPVSRAFEVPAMDRRVDAALGDGLTLLGFDLPTSSIQPGEPLAATLYWQARAPVDRSYKVFLHLIDDTGKLWTQWDSPPVLGGYPTSEWMPGEVVADRIRLPVGADTPPGTYRLFTGMYDEATGERLPLVWQGQRLAGDTSELAVITVQDQPAERTP